MRRGAHGKEFGKTLDDAEEDREQVVGQEFTW
jgi:hypothetical protein